MSVKLFPYTYLSVNMGLVVMINMLNLLNKQTILDRLIAYFPKSKIK